ncbi:MAG: bifunctional oligoribonuclease/PAP phosphatase NrnA, partial [Gemmatimonadetes bacterium]|nr:bifunctional oligoribonuclease/PAP phosphatase NrnA [Gemmatimonadota bacterium]
GHVIPDFFAVPAGRRADIERLLAELSTGQTVALSTHINSDGDGCGSEAALAGLLAQRGIRAFIVNPTPWPAMFRYLLDEGGIDDRSAKGAKALAGADRLIVLDISDVKRLGALADAVRALPKPPLVIDHHLPGDEPPGTLHVTDITACATGELIFDVAQVMGAELTPAIATAIYTAMVTDTGGFRFSNTSPRCHAVAARLLGAGVDPEAMYRRIYASVPRGRLELIRDALATLQVDAAHGLAWVEIESGLLEKHGVSAEDLDGVAEYPRSIEGTRLALLFRDLGHGKVKVSFRSTGVVDSNALARQFGGGGHAKASGALITGSMDTVRALVLAAAREHVGVGA